ncbi:arsenate reductase [Sphingorhabdus lutea]|uniref:Arsenate reductase n=1 Tax=Sphingorhabdus lutea TaxID=1913578 RepID=A0A1L3JEE9_9SPHN|nr:ArsC family reductase [Sphingorhabdus lutea]APG63423.1 arsenate reductase [Sphingorhabdus lutea]
MNVKIYGIPNCDTMKKARVWLENAGIKAEFHDYKKLGIDTATLNKWCDIVGFEPLLNKRGTTFRKLDDADKADIDKVKAVRLMADNPSMIKRPVAEYDGGLLVGFTPDEYAQKFA